MQMNRERAVQKRKCFGYGGFRYIMRNCRMKEAKEIATLQSSNKFEVLASKMMNMEEGRGKEIKKDSKKVLREERAKEKKERPVEARKIEEGESLREVTVKIKLERIDTQEEIIVEVLLDSRAIGLVISLEFAKKQWFKFKKIERPIYIRNMDGFFNKEESIEHTVKVNIYYQRYREQIEIDVIGEQKWSVILGISWLFCHNPEIDWKTREVKIMRCQEECRKQQRLKQEKLE